VLTARRVEENLGVMARETLTGDFRNEGEIRRAPSHEGRRERQFRSPLTQSYANLSKYVD
jgi:hypothetical protein